MVLRSRLSLPSTAATTPEARWRDIMRYARQLRDELVEYRGKVTARAATRAELVAYAKGDHEERDDAVMQLLYDQEKAICAGCEPFSGTPPVAPPQTGPTRLGRWKQALRHLERLRLWHNVEGAKRNAGAITQRQWDKWKSDVWRPRQTACHAVLQAHRDALEVP